MEKKECLRDLPLSILTAFAEKHGLPVSQPVSRTEIIASLCELTEAELAEISFYATRFELSKHPDKIEFENRLEELHRRTEKMIEGEGRSTAHLKVLYAAVGAGAALLLSVATAVTVKQTFTAQELQATVEEKTEYYESLAERIEGSGVTAVVAAVTAIMDESKILVAEVNTLRLREVERDRISSERLRIETLLPFSPANDSDASAPQREEPAGQGQGISSEYWNLLKSLLEFYESLEKMTALTGLKNAAYLDEVLKVESDFLDLQIPDFDSELAKTFGSQLDAWRHNSVGVLQVQEFQEYWRNENTAEANAALAKAQTSFELAIERDPLFARPYTNIALVKKRYYDRDFKKYIGNIAGHEKQLRKWLQESQVFIADALARQRSTSVSSTYNNSSFYYLLEAELVHIARNSIPDVDTLMEKARDAMANAESKHPVAATVYTTQAEILAFEIELAASRGQPGFLDDELKRQRKLEEVLYLVARACRGGFDRYAKVKFDKIIEQSSMYRYLERLKIKDWEESLEKAFTCEETY